MNESKIPTSRTPSQPSSSANHSVNNNGTVKDGPYNSANRPQQTLHKTEHGKGSHQQLQQYKTVQIISQPNHAMSTSSGSCVLVQQMGNSNHAMNFQQINPQQSSQTTTQGSQMNYRQGNSNANQNQPQIAVSEANGTKSVNHVDRNQIQVQNSQIPPRYTSQVHQLQDGRQVQMIQVNNSAYYQLSSGQNSQQPITLQQYVQQQQQFMSNNGGQSVLIASQGQDGSRTLQAIPAQIHTIQHTVSPQNQSFQITKAATKNVKSTAGQQIKRNEQIVQVTSNGNQFVMAGQSQVSQSQIFQQFQPQTPVKTSSRSKPKVTPSKAKNLKNAPIPTQTQQQPPQLANNVGQNHPKVHQIIIPPRPGTNQDKHFAEKTATTTASSTPALTTIHSQSPSVSMPPPPLPIVKQNPTNSVARHNQPIVIHAAPPPVIDFKSPSKKQINQNRQIRSQVVPQNSYQKPLVAPGHNSTIRTFAVPTLPQQNSTMSQAQKVATEQQQKQKIHQILQTATNAQKKVLPTQTDSERVTNIAQPSPSDISSVFKNPVIVPIKPPTTSQVRVPEIKPTAVPVISQTTLQKQAVPVIPTTIPVKTKPLEVKKPSEITTPTKSSPIPGDPSNSIIGKLNLDLAVGDPKDSYRVLKKHFKCLVYENECYQGQLRDSHQRLLKLERDNNYLMDRLLKYESLSDSDEEESESLKTKIEERTAGQKSLKRKPTSKSSMPPPPKKKPNLSKSIASGTSNTTSIPPVVKKEPAIPILQKPEITSTKTKTTNSNKANTSTTSQKVHPPKMTSNSAPRTCSRTPLSNTPTKRSTPVIQKISSEHVDAVKKEGKIVKMMTPSTFKTFQTKLNFGIIDDDACSTIPKPLVGNKLLNTMPKPLIPEPKTLVSNTTATPVKTTKPTPPKVTVEIKELPLKPSIIKPFDQAKLNDLLSKTSNGPNEVPKTPKVFVPLKFMPRNPTPQSRASISYSAIKSPSIARMMGARSGPTRMVRPSPVGRFEILSTSPIVQQAAMRAQTPVIAIKSMDTGGNNNVVSPEKSVSNSKQSQI